MTQPMTYSGAVELESTNDDQEGVVYMMPASIDFNGFLLLAPVQQDTSEVLGVANSTFTYTYTPEDETENPSSGFCSAIEVAARDTVPQTYTIRMRTW